MDWLFHGLLILAIAPGVATQPAATTQEFDERIEEFLASDTVKVLSVEHRAVLTTASEDQLVQLIPHPDTTLALAAGWERVRRTLPKRKESDGIPLDALALARFIGLLEGRAKVTAPREWEKAFMTAQAGWRADELPRVGFRTEYDRRVREYESNPSHPDPNPVVIPGTTQPAGDDNRCIVKSGAASWTLQIDEADRFDSALVRIDHDKAYIALYPEYPVGKLRIFELDPKTGITSWSSEVWVQEIYGGFSGYANNQVELAFTPGEVCVFGITYDAAYAACLDRRTGKTRWRFSTAFWDYDLND